MDGFFSGFPIGTAYTSGAQQVLADGPQQQLLAPSTEAASSLTLDQLERLQLQPLQQPHHSAQVVAQRSSAPAWHGAAAAPLAGPLAGWASCPATPSPATAAATLAAAGPSIPAVHFAHSHHHAWHGSATAATAPGLDSAALMASPSGACTAPGLRGYAGGGGGGGSAMADGGGSGCGGGGGSMRVRSFSVDGSACSSGGSSDDRPAPMTASAAAAHAATAAAAPQQSRSRQWAKPSTRQRPKQQQQEGKESNKRIRNVLPCPGCGTLLAHAQWYVHQGDIRRQGFCRGAGGAATGASAPCSPPVAAEGKADAAAGRPVVPVSPLPATAASASAGGPSAEGAAAVAATASAGSAAATSRRSGNGTSPRLLKTKAAAVPVAAQPHAHAVKRPAATPAAAPPAPALRAAAAVTTAIPMAMPPQPTLLLPQGSEMRAMRTAAAAVAVTEGASGPSSKSACIVSAAAAATAGATSSYPRSRGDALCLAPPAAHAAVMTVGRGMAAEVAATRHQHQQQQQQQQPAALLAPAGGSWDLSGVCRTFATGQDDVPVELLVDLRDGDFVRACEDMSRRSSSNTGCPICAAATSTSTSATACCCRTRASGPAANPRLVAYPPAWSAATATGMGVVTTQQPTPSPPPPALRQQPHSFSGAYTAAAAVATHQQPQAPLWMQPPHQQPHHQPHQQPLHLNHHHQLQHHLHYQQPPQLQPQLQMQLQLQLQPQPQSHHHLTQQQLQGNGGTHGNNGFHNHGGRYGSVSASSAGAGGFSGQPLQSGADVSSLQQSLMPSPQPQARWWCQQGSQDDMRRFHRPTL
ncbi:hypothetical protein HXX76_016185 [Chlamydomonas incerta]|uniref:Uncharacterized protein n=1 Tax=Chlamydomonas incerta TaxID=51695 RepID=A0A835VMC3_CHLIN|nr:hypothetical protein HXX76_016185 [Chlamydomonas incerta]|eukprot:KAG2422232.1 hypothetical protein HXX76_016185 [Chlamydomonas incerta]